MNLVDSSGWLEYLSGSKNADRFAPAIQNIEDLIISPIIIYEVYKKVISEKGEDAANAVLGLMSQAKIVQVDLSIAVEAARLNAKKKIPMADSIIYVTAIQNNAMVWTQDYDFKNLKNVKFFKK